MKESPSPPGSQAVIETLVKVAHTMQETSFQWTFIDKPKGGLKLLETTSAVDAELTIGLLCNSPPYP